MPATHALTTCVRVGKKVSLPVTLILRLFIQASYSMLEDILDNFDSQLHYVKVNEETFGFEGRTQIRLVKGW